MHLTLLKRPRRNRRTESIRLLVEETSLRPENLVVPLFVLPGEKRRIEIKSMPGVFQLSIDEIIKEAERLHLKNIPAIALFPVIDSQDKDTQGSYALREDGLIPLAISILKREIPSLCIIADIALDPFTVHGHDGIIDEKGWVLNDPTVSILEKMALVYARSGADLVAPSDMMDGRIGRIRKYLDHHDFNEVGILSYCAKYASSLYSPFRDAVNSSLKIGDKKGYQINPANKREALVQASLDEQEGADILMVKPALFYLDVIAKMREHSHLPICAYHVSGEYAMVMAAHERGYLDASKVFYEALLSIKRAGADFILSYAAEQILTQLASSR